MQSNREYNIKIKLHEQIDTIIGNDHKGALLTINDRKTGIVKIRKLTGKEADPLAEETIKVLLPFKNLIHTITADNEKEPQTKGQSIRFSRKNCTKVKNIV